jgi:hypothetical protein
MPTTEPALLWRSVAAELTRLPLLLLLLLLLPLPLLPLLLLLLLLLLWSPSHGPTVEWSSVPGLSCRPRSLPREEAEAEAKAAAAGEAEEGEEAPAAAAGLMAGSVADDGLRLPGAVVRGDCVDDPPLAACSCCCPSLPPPRSSSSSSGCALS